MPNPVPKNPNPIELTVRQWRALARVTRASSVANHTAWIAFRPGDVVATDGKRLVSIPLPADPHRDFALLNDDLAPWVSGLPKRVMGEEGDVDGEGEGEQYKKVEHRLTLEIDCANDIARTRSNYCGGEVRVTIRPPSWRIRDDGLDQVLAIAAEGLPPTHLLQTRYLRDLHRLARAFGPDRMPGATIRRAVQGDYASIFTFPTQDGDARYVVMRLRQAGEE